MSDIVVLISAMQQGVLASIALELAANHRITIVTRSDGLRAKILNSFPDFTVPIEVRPEIEVDLSPTSIIEASLIREAKYGEKFAMIASYERGLGKGYIFNADRHPDMARSWWPHARKLEAVLSQFLFYEQLFDDFHPDAVISLVNTKALSLVARANGARALGITQAKFGNRYLWSDDEYLQSSFYSDAIQRHLSEPGNTPNEDVPSYPANLDTTLRHAGIDYSYRGALVKSVLRIYRESYVRLRTLASSVIRHRRRPDARQGYSYLGWLPAIIRRPHAFKHLRRHGYTPSDLTGKTIIYFPLHLEPEIALLSASPEFNNSMELIAWVSKSLPADGILVVKEQPIAFGIRSIHYYNNLRRMPNVVLADPQIPSWEWIRTADVVVTITGSAGFEAVYFDRPVLSFGQHQVINHLPSVRYAHDFASTQLQLNNLLNNPLSSAVLQHSKQALYRAMLDSSFELPGFEHTYGTATAQSGLALLAVEQLTRFFPEAFPKA